MFVFSTGFQYLEAFPKHDIVRDSVYYAIRAQALEFRLPGDESWLYPC